MNTSPEIKELAAALSKAQGEMGGAVKDTSNPFFKSKYADLASIRDAIRVPFAKHGLAVIQLPRTEFAGAPEPYEWTAKSGEKRYGVRVVCIVSVVTRLTHESGQFVEGDVSTMLSTGDPQAVGSAISYLRRYALQSVAGVAPEDDDGEAATGKGRHNGDARHEEPEERPRVLTRKDQDAIVAAAGAAGIDSATAWVDWLTMQAEGTAPGATAPRPALKGITKTSQIPPAELEWVLAALKRQAEIRAGVDEALLPREVGAEG